MKVDVVAGELLDYLGHMGFRAAALPLARELTETERAAACQAVRLEILDAAIRWSTLRRRYASPRRPRLYRAAEQKPSPGLRRRPHPGR